MNIQTTIPLLPANPSYSPLWAQQFDRASKSKNLQKAATPKLFCGRLKEHAPALWAGESGLKLSEDESDAILSKLEAGLELCQQQIIQNAFREGLSIGNRGGRWSIALPPLRQVVSRYANPIKPQHIVLLSPFTRIKNGLIKRLEGILDSGPAELAGAILFSAAAFDGLVDGRRLETLVRIGLSALSIDKGVCIADLGDSGTWFPGALTQTLIFSYQRRFGLPLCGDNSGTSNSPDTPVKPATVAEALRALGSFLPELSSLDRELLKDRIPSLCRAYHASIFPGYLLSYIQGVNKSTSLPVARYRDIFAGKPHNATMHVQPRGKAIAARRRDQNNGHRELRMQMIRQQIESLVAPTNAAPKDVLANITALIDAEGTWPIQKLLGAWVIHKIDETAKKDGAWSSLIRYYQALWWPLFSTALDEDPCTMSETGLIAWIDRALEQHRTDSSQLYFQQQIGDFLRFLSSRYGTPKIQFADLECWISDSVCQVNSDWISPGEFDRIIELLSGDKIVKEPWMREVCVLVARICYRGGTRRLEPLQARVMDLQPSKTPELIIREGVFGSLKSDQAERRIPLQGLFTETEVRELLAYHSRRMQASSPDAPLFSSPDTPDLLLSSEKVYRYITKAMMLATGRGDVVVHLLRHGCANTRLLQLEIADGSIELPYGLEGFSHPEFSPERCEAVKNALFQRIDRDEPDTGERNLYALSLLLGHLSPSTTMKSYLHMLDFILYMHAHTMQPAIKGHMLLAKCIGLGHSRTYQLPRSGTKLSLEGLLPEIQRRHLEARVRLEAVDPATENCPG